MKCICPICMWPTEIYTKRRSPATNSAPDSKENFEEMVGNDSLQITIITKSKLTNCSCGKV